MGWKDVRVGSGQYLTLKDDGNKATVVFLGEPCEQAFTGAGGKARRRYLFNVAQAETAEKCLVFPCGPTLADEIREKLQDGKLAGQVWVTITRRGRSGDRDTKYELSGMMKLTPAQKKRVAALELVDLAAEKPPSGDKF